MSLFIATALGVWAFLHLYVFRCLGSLPWLKAAVPQGLLWLLCVLAWGSYPTVFLLRRLGWQRLSEFQEVAASTWMGAAFILFSLFLLVDLATGWGLWLRPWLPMARSLALGLGLVLVAVAVVQGRREPVLRQHEVSLDGLPLALDGKRLLLLTDLHLGRQLGAAWLEALVRRVEELKPDLIVLAGDLVDGEVSRVEPLTEQLSRLRAPLGVYAVLGNHEFYAGADASAQILRRAGFRVLRNEAVTAVAGLRLAGVDDLDSLPRFGLGDRGRALERALAMGGEKEGACILISHTPVEAETAARLGADLMLSGHTHGGQIWPFGLLVKARYPLFAGRYQRGTLTVLVSRGAGTWGPRLRLFAPGEMLQVRLLSPGGLGSPRKLPQGR